MNEIFHINEGLGVSFSKRLVDTSLEERRALCDLWGEGGDATLLAFADDGVIWGRLDRGALAIGRDAQPGTGRIPAYSPELRWKTLWGGHVFNGDCELRIWKQGEALYCTHIAESVDPTACFYDEEQILLGTDKIDYAEVAGKKVMFTRLQDLAGEWHAPPIGPGDFKRRALKLRIRHYLREDNDSGMLCVWASRIAELKSPGVQQ